jgi:hypothetical protein
MAASNEWSFLYPPKPDGTIGTNSGPFRQLAGNVLFPERVDIAAFPSEPAAELWCRLRFEIEVDQVICSEVAFVRIPGAAAIGASTIRNVDIGSLIDKAFVWQATASRQSVQVFEGVFGPDGYSIDADGRVSLWTEADIAKAEKDALALRRQRTITDDHLREVAEIYLSDGTGAPTEAVKDQMDTSKRNATRWVAQARERGLIPPYERRTHGVD